MSGGADAQTGLLEWEEAEIRTMDEERWTCSLTRWYRDFLGEWATAESVRDADGCEVLHSGACSYPFTPEGARTALADAHGFVPALAERTRRLGL